MKCHEKRNRFAGDDERCGKPVVACVETAILKPIELCAEHAEKYAKNGAKVHYYGREV